MSDITKELCGGNWDLPKDVADNYAQPKPITDEEAKRRNDKHWASIVAANEKEKQDIIRVLQATASGDTSLVTYESFDAEYAAYTGLKVDGVVIDKHLLNTSTIGPMVKHLKFNDDEVLFAIVEIKNFMIEALGHDFRLSVAMIGKHGSWQDRTFEQVYMGRTLTIRLGGYVSKSPMRREYISIEKGKR